MPGVFLILLPRDSGFVLTNLSLKSHFPLTITQLLPSTQLEMALSPMFPAKSWVNIHLPQNSRYGSLEHLHHLSFFIFSILEPLYEPHFYATQALK